MPDSEQDPEHEVSASLFNNRYFTRVVQAVAEVGAAQDGLVTTRAVAAATGVSDSLVRPVILRLEAGRVLHRLPRAGLRGAQYFSVVPGELWDALLAVAELTILGSSVSPRREGSKLPKPGSEERRTRL
jgi:hypothetical protein